MNFATVDSTKYSSNSRFANQLLPDVSRSNHNTLHTSCKLISNARISSLLLILRNKQKFIGENLLASICNRRKSVHYFSPNSLLKAWLQQKHVRKPSHPLSWSHASRCSKLSMFGRALRGSSPSAMESPRRAAELCSCVVGNGSKSAVGQSVKWSQNKPEIRCFKAYNNIASYIVLPYSSSIERTWLLMMARIKKNKMVLCSGLLRAWPLLCAYISTNMRFMVVHLTIFHFCRVAVVISN